MSVEKRKVYTYEERCQVVKAIQNGASPSEVESLLGVSTRCTFRWLAWYRSGGWHGLKSAPKSGRPKKVTGVMLSWLYDAITMNDPRQYQMDFCLWTLNIVRSVLKRQFGVVLSKSSVSRLLNQMGLSPQRPIYRFYKQDPKKLERYLKKTFPELKEHARRIGAEIYFVDEAAVRSDNHHGTSWAAVGDTPVVEDSGDRFGMKLISAVSARGDMRFQVIEGRMNSERFCAFLEKLSEDAGKPVIVICDNASYHKSKKTRAFGADLENPVELHTLPEYSPELNPDEQVWNHLKRMLGKKFVDTKDEMKRTTLNAMRFIQRQTRLIRSFFRMNNTKYTLA